MFLSAADRIEGYEIYPIIFTIHLYLNIGKVLYMYM